MKDDVTEIGRTVRLRKARRSSIYERVMSRAWCWIVSRGLVPATWPGRPVIGPTTLEVKGRRSGLLRRVAVTWIEVDGSRYLVSMMGEESDWIHNVRAAQGRAVARRGRRRGVLLDELPVADRAPILQAWLSRAGRSSIPRKYVGLDRDAPLEAFESIAPRWPVFRMTELPK